MSDRTELQEQILEQVSDDPDSTNQEIADAVDCSPSYVSEVRQQFRSITGEPVDVTGSHVFPSYTHPYSVLATSQFLQKSGLEAGSLIKLEIDDSKQVIHAPIKRMDGDLLEERIHAQWYTLMGLPELTERNVERGLSEYYDSDKEELNIYDSERVEGFLDSLRNIVHDTLSRTDLLIGVGLLERTVSSIAQKSIQTPYFTVSDSTLKESYNEEVEVISSISAYTGPVSTPDKVYFETAVEPDRELSKQLVRKIKDIQYFDITNLYTIPGVRVALGPIDEKGVDKTLISVENSDIEIVTTRSQTVSLHGDLEQTPDPEYIYEILEEIRVDDEPLPVAFIEESELITIRLRSLNILLFVEDNELIWVYPTEIAALSKFIELLTEGLVDTLSVDYTLQEESVGPPVSVPPSDSYVYDTNSLYHQVSEGKDDAPTNILRSFWPYPEFYKSDIHIPWIVLYEMNKHKDKGNADNRAVEQGIENVQTLRVLSEYGFIDLTIDEFPEQIGGNIGESDIADQYVLHYAQTTDANLLTMDKRLTEIAEVADIYTVDISSFAQVQESESLTEEINSEIKPNIGYSLNKHSDIIEAISDQVELEEHQKRPGHTTSDPRAEAESHLERWVENEEIIAYPQTTEESGDTDLYYERCDNLAVVPTTEVVQSIDSVLTEYNSERYFSKRFLDEIRSSVEGLGQNLPRLHVRIPRSTITKLHTTSQDLYGGSTIPPAFQSLYQILGAENAEYSAITVSEPYNETSFNTAICGAAQEDAVLLAMESENLDRISRLYGIEVVSLEEKLFE